MFYQGVIALRLYHVDIVAIPLLLGIVVRLVVAKTLVKMNMIMEELELAKKIVSNAFADKNDKAGKPYLGHLLRVSEKLPNSLKTIGLLHDLLEDCPEWTEKALRHIFSEVIVDTVVLLTRGKSETYGSYIAKIKTDDWATIVKIADLEDNLNLARLTDINQIDIKRLEKYVTAYNQLTAKN